MLGRVVRPLVRTSRVNCSATCIRAKRYDAYGAELDTEMLEEARKWNENFDPSLLPKGLTTYARSSGPGGQHVNKYDASVKLQRQLKLTFDTFDDRTETKAISVYPIKDIIAILPRFLHSSIRSSQYYVASSDSLTFQAQAHRSRSANADDNKRKLMAEISKLYNAKVPAETSDDKKGKYREVYVADTDSFCNSTDYNLLMGIATERIASTARA